MAARPTRFVERVQRLLAHDPHASPASARPSAASIPRAGGPSWPKVILIGGAAVIASGYLVVDRLLLSKPPADTKLGSASIWSAALCTWDVDGYRRSLEAFRKAIALDPDYAAA